MPRKNEQKEFRKRRCCVELSFYGVGIITTALEYGTVPGNENAMVSDKLSV